MKSRTLLLALPFLAFAALMPSGLHGESSSLRILKFEADWCGACKAMKPAFAAVAKSTEGVKFESVDIDRQSSMAERYGVTLLPTVIAVKDGREVGRLTGVQSQMKLKNFVKKHR